MRPEDFPGTIAEPDIERAQQLAEELEVQAPDGLHEFGRYLAARAMDTSDVSESLVGFEGLICMFMLGEGDARERHESALTPWAEFGGEQSPPGVPWYPEAMRPYLIKRTKAARRPEVRARLSDFVWERWHDVSAARSAVDAYLEASDVPDAEERDYGAAMHYLIRAAELAVLIDHRADDVRSTIVNEVERTIGGSNLGYPCWLMERCARLLLSDQESARRLIEQALHAGQDAGARSERHPERSYLESALALAHGLKDQKEANSIRRLMAESLEHEAEEQASRGGLVESHFLSEAMQVYQDLGDSAAFQRLKPRIIAANERSLAEMHTISVSAPFPIQAIEEATGVLTAAHTSEPPSSTRTPARGRNMAGMEVDERGADAAGAARHDVLANAYRI
jgi:hypothetical protein